MKKSVILFALFALTLVPAWGATIDFATGGLGVGGTFTLNGSNATGTNIPIGNVTISGAPLNNGVFAVTGGCNGGGCLSFDTAANTISIIGAIPGLGIGSETLLSGSFTSFTASTNGLTDATGPDTKAADLLAITGLTGSTFSLFGFSLTTAPGANTIISTDIRNTNVPEPASIMLFGTGLCSLAGVLRRKLRR